MKISARRASSTRQRPENDVEDTSFVGGSGLRPTSYGRFRTIRTLQSNDRITETSLTRVRIRDNATQAEGDEGIVRDTPHLPEDVDDSVAVETDDRPRRILSLLLRPQSRELLQEVVSTDDPKTQQQRLGRVVLSSHDALYAFARLVTDGGLAVSDGRLVTTPLTNRILKTISETSKA